MVKANELRIGNYILLDGKPIKVIAGVIVDMHYCEEIDGGDERYQPIPLTPEVLEKCGFTVAGDKEYGGWITPFYGVLKDDAFRIRINGMGTFYYSPDKYANPIYLHSLHQLQNWFFALTGEELEYKP